MSIIKHIIQGHFSGYSYCAIELDPIEPTHYCISTVLDNAESLLKMDTLICPACIHQIINILMKFVENAEISKEHKAYEESLTQYLRITKTQLTAEMNAIINNKQLGEQA
jgi:hypothetical protein